MNCLFAYYIIGEIIIMKGEFDMISTRGRYAIRVLIDLAENENGSSIPHGTSLPGKGSPRSISRSSSGTWWPAASLPEPAEKAAATGS